MGEFPETNAAHLKFSHVCPRPSAENAAVPMPDGILLLVLKFDDV